MHGSNQAQHRQQLSLPPVHALSLVGGTNNDNLTTRHRTAGQKYRQTVKRSRRCHCPCYCTR